jgi:hypothetical protein
MSVPKIKLRDSGSGMVHMHSWLRNVYQCLLADIAMKSKVSLEAPGDISIAWLLTEGPSLDKLLLRWIEDGGEYPQFPTWLLPLTERFRALLRAEDLKSIRQLLVFCYKTELEPTNEQLRTAQAEYEAVEENNRYYAWLFDKGQKGPAYNWLHSTARRFVSQVIANIPWSQISPSHGPGAVWPSCPASEKTNWDTINAGIDREYPYCDNFALLPNYWKEASWNNKYLSESDDITCNLVAVPKDSRGPRLISVHPKEAIWVQQGQRYLLEDAIHRHPTTRGRINFRDQSVNGKLALRSSSDGTLCTLDLKDASDRLTAPLVEYLFGGAYRWIGCSRATRCRLFDGKHIRLLKYAPMGNCLTFPIQSLCFWSLVRAGILCRYGVICNDVYVFGDDIIFPSKYYDGAIQGLVDSNLVVNVSKTFRKGLFRESCGVDAYNGEDVTPHRLKRYVLSRYSACQSVCTLAKAMRIDGYDKTSAFLYKYVSENIGMLPLSNNLMAQGIYEYEPRLEITWRRGKTRYNVDLQRWESRIYMTRAQREHLSRDDWYHLQDGLNRLEHKYAPSASCTDARPLPGDEPGDVVRGLEYTVPYCDRLVYGWTPLQKEGDSLPVGVSIVSLGSEKLVAV